MTKHFFANIAFSLFLLSYPLTTCSKSVLPENTQLPDTDKKIIEYFPLKLNIEPDITRKMPLDITYMHEMDTRSIDFRNNVTICSIHSIEMEKKEVRIIYGLLGGEWWGYTYRIREKLFPNCDDILEGGCMVGFGPEYAEIYVCQECNNDRNIWMKENWTSWTEKYSWEGTGFPPEGDRTFY